MPVVAVRSLRRKVVYLHTPVEAEVLTVEEFLARQPKFFDEEQKRIFLKDLIVNDRAYVWPHPKGFVLWEHSLAEASHLFEEELNDIGIDDGDGEPEC